jgi:hypothetical protein
MRIFGNKAFRYSVFVSSALVTLALLTPPRSAADGKGPILVDLSCQQPCERPPTCVQVPGPKIILEMSAPEVTFNQPQAVSVAQPKHRFLHRLFHHHQPATAVMVAQPLMTSVVPAAVPQVAAIPVPAMTYAPVATAAVQMQAVPMAAPAMAAVPVQAVPTPAPAFVSAPSMSFAPAAATPSFVAMPQVAAQPVAVQPAACPSIAVAPMPSQVPIISHVPGPSACASTASGENLGSLENLIKMKTAAQMLESRATALLTKGLTDSLAMQQMAISTLMDGKGMSSHSPSAAKTSPGLSTTPNGSSLEERMKGLEQSTQELKDLLKKLAQ